MVQAQVRLAEIAAQENERRAAKEEQERRAAREEQERRAAREEQEQERRAAREGDALCSARDLLRGVAGVDNLKLALAREDVGLAREVIALRRMSDNAEEFAALVEKLVRQKWPT
jgi:hypothetical protein